MAHTHRSLLAAPTRATRRLARPLRLLVAGTALTLVPAVVDAGVTASAGSAPAATPTAAVAAKAASCRRAPVPKRKSTRFGTNLTTTTASLSDALGVAERHFGHLGVVRLYDSGVPPTNAWTRRAALLHKRAVVTSFRMPPAQVLAGTYDARMRHFFATAPRHNSVYWSYYHEPEPVIASGAFTAAQYRAAWRHLVGLAQQACNPRLFPTLILTGWTAEPGSGRNWRTYYPGRRSISVLAWDPYNSASGAPRSYVRPRVLFKASLAASRAAGKRYAIAETGSQLVRGDSGVGRARWLTRVGRFTARKHAAFVSYYNTIGPKGVDYRLLDASSIAAWNNVVR